MSDLLFALQPAKFLCEIKRLFDFFLIPIFNYAVINNRQEITEKIIWELGSNFVAMWGNKLKNSDSRDNSVICLKGAH